MPLSAAQAIQWAEGGPVVDKGFHYEPFRADQPAANQRQPPLQAEASELIHP